MRLQLALILSVVCISAYSAAVKKFDYLAGFSNVQVLGVDHRGIQIMHNTGICHLKTEDLSDSDLKLLKEEVDLVAVKQKQYQERQAKLKKMRAASAKKSKAELKKQTDAQNKEINALVKKYADKSVYDVVKVFEAEFGLTKNARNMGLKGRVKSVVSHLERKYPLARKVKQSFQPKNVSKTKLETKTGKDDKKVTVRKTVVIAKKEPPVMMNALSQSIVKKRIAWEDKYLSKAAAKVKAAEEKAKAKEGGEDGGGAAEESAPAESGGGADGGADGEAGGADGEAGGEDGGAE